MEKEIKMDAGNVRVVDDHKTYEQAMSSAYAESASTAGWTFPVVMFRQGTRMFLSGAFPIGFVESRLVSAAGEKGSGVKGARASMNRPIDSKHTRVISEYIEANAGTKYIIPPLTLNVQQQVTLHTIASGQSFKAGYLVIPAGVNLSITDGQHRKKGLIQALAVLSGKDSDITEVLRRDSIAVMITCEHDVKQIHQDFADCSKTKALPASLLSVYDTRNPGNRLVFDLEQQCPLFRGKIDSTSKTLSKKSVHLFLANQVRRLVKSLMTKRNIQDADFDKVAAEQLGSEEKYNTYLSKYASYLNYVTDTIPVLKKIANLPVDSPEKAQIPKIREEGWVCITATGLDIIGYVGHDLITYGVPEWQSYVDKFADIDWKRSGQLWRGNIVTTGRLLTQVTAIRAAASALRDEIGLTAYLKRTGHLKDEAPKPSEDMTK